MDIDKLLSAIADPKINKKALMQAIKDLGPVTEPSQFWANIANCDKYNKNHRRYAVFQLFKRHVSSGLTLFELARILDNPRWLADDDITIVTGLAGKIPIKWTFEDTVFVIAVFPELTDNGYDRWAIYLRVSGKITRESLIRVLRGEIISENMRNARIPEFALIPDDPIKWELTR